MIQPRARWSLDFTRMFGQSVVNSEHAAAALNVAVELGKELPLEKRIVFLHIGIRV